MSFDYFEESMYRSQKSLTFDGIQEWMIALLLFGGDTFKIRRATVSSINIWVKNTKESGAVIQVIMSRWAPTNTLEVNEAGWRIYIEDRIGVDRACVFHLSSSFLSGIWIYSQAEFPLNEWVMVTLTYNGNGQCSGLKMYWNAVLQTTNIIFDNWHTDTDPSNSFSHLTWGFQYTFWDTGAPSASVTFSYWFEGLMDETTLWRYELNQSEISQLFHCGKPKSPLNIGLPNGKPVSTHFRMGDGSDGTLAVGILYACWGKYPVTSLPAGNRVALWNISESRESLDVPS